MSSFKTIISHCGVIHIAKAAKISPRAVYKWLARDCLPRTEFTGETNYSEIISDLSGGTYSPDEVRAAGRYQPNHAA